jgi:hypothetical protein
MNAIIQFENHQNVATRLRNSYLEPELRRVSLLGNTTILFQDYLNRTAPGAPVLTPQQVVLAATQQWEALNTPPERTVFIFDLDPAGSSTPDSSYGLCVLVGLAKQFGLSLEEFLSSQYFLSVVLTLYPANLQATDGIGRLLRAACNLSELERLWSRVRRLRPQSSHCPAEQAPRIILANSGIGEAWLSSTVVKWLSQR